MSSPPQNLLPQVDLGNTFGALFIGVTLAAVLFGVTNVQAFVYFQTNRGTGTLSKLVVIWLWVLDALHLALIIHCIYYYLVTNYANISALTEVAWSFKLQMLFEVLIIYGIHVLYAYRIWIVSKGRSRVIPAAVCMIITLASGVVIATVWAVYQCHVLTDFAGIQWAAYMVLSTTAFVDFIIASSLCYLLTTSRTGFSSTDSFLTRLVVYIVNTGCMTSASSMVAIITCAVMPTNLIFFGVEFLLAKLYVNSYLALLNARHFLQPHNLDTTDISGLRAYRPSPHNKESEDRKLQHSSKDVSRLQYDPYGPLYPTCPVQAVMLLQPIAVTMEKSSFSSV